MQKKKVTILFLFVSFFCSSMSFDNKKIEINDDTSFIYDTNENIEKEEHVDEEIIIEETIDDTKLEYLNKVKVYINPSVQTKNLYINGLGNEAENMKKIAIILDQKLSKVPFIECKTNLSDLSLSKSLLESNQFGADIHLALHSNAGGGSGSEIYTINSLDFTKIVYKNYVSLNSFPQRGIKNGGHLYELKTSKAKHAALIEMQFHDNLLEATWICNNYEAIADNLYESIYSYASKILD